MHKFLTKGVQRLIKIYSVLVSPLFANTCRFHPSCSCYMHDAIEAHGVFKGVWLGVKRLLKCHPWHKADTLIDPVPKPLSRND